MKKSLFASSLLVATVLATGAFAANGNVFIDQVSSPTTTVDHPQYGRNETLSVTSTGTSNKVYARQGINTGATLDPSSAGEKATIKQTGNSDTSNMIEVGVNNTVNMTTTGNSDLASTRVNDNFSTVGIAQSGNGNIARIGQGVVTPYAAAR